MSSLDDDRALDELVTLRDLWRYGTSRFNGANLVYGHGTNNAADESAFLLLSALQLPVDELDRWLDCRLTKSERKAALQLFRQRIKSRKPASYLTHTAWIQGRKFYVDENVIVPRSYIGELICCNRLSAAVADPDAVTRVLDLCTGSGCLAILAAEAFPSATITASDISVKAIEVAKRNVASYGLEERIELVKSDLFEKLKPEAYDLIISNPPYVPASAVAAFPPEYKAEPKIAHHGGEDGLTFVRRILDRAPEYLSAHGALVVEIGQARQALELRRPDLPFLWLDTETSEGEVFALQANEFKRNTRT